MNALASKLYKRITNFTLAFLVATGTLTIVGPYVGSVSAAPPPAGTQVVHGNTAAAENSEGWLFNRDPSTSTPFTFNTDQSVLGIGSLYVKPISASSATDKFIGENFLLSNITDINSFSFDYKIGAGGVASDYDQIYMSVYANYGSSSPTKFYDCRYNVLASSGSTSSFTTLSFNPNNAYTVTTRAGSPVCPVIPSEMNLVSAGSTIRTIAINVGDTSLGDAGIDAYLDNVVVNSVNGVTTYDFEPRTVNACSATSSVYTSDITDWDLSQTRANGHNEIVDNGLHIYTDGSGDTGPRTDGNPGTWNTDKAAGYRSSDFALADAGVPSLTYVPAFGIEPSIQMVTDFDNNGTTDGILVGESVYGNDWWVPDSAAQFVKDGAPSHSGGSGSANHGTLDQWLNAFPNARVKQIGYSLGSGVYGDGVITNLTVGCTAYTYGPEIAPEQPGNGGETVTGTTTTTTTATSIITPIITNPASVLGVDTSTEGSTDVEGTTDDKTASVKEGFNGIILGLAWYWWILILAGATGLTWWILAAYRRRNTEE